MKIMEFSAKWCMPCKMLAPVLEDIEKELNIQIDRIDIDEDMENTIKYGINVVPTMLLIKENKVISKITGNISKKEIIDWIRNN